MTREEASNILDDYDVNFDGHTAEEIAEAFEVAFRALEQEPCEDAISRQAVIDILKDKWNIFSDANDAMQESIDTIEALLPVNPQPKTEWIPVSERLPEDSGEYLVSVIDDEDEDYKHVGVAYFAHPNDYDIDKGEWRELMIDEKVIAWMPLPSPYAPQESEG